MIWDENLIVTRYLFLPFICTVLIDVLWSSITITKTAETVTFFCSHFGYNFVYYITLMTLMCQGRR